MKLFIGLFVFISAVYAKPLIKTQKSHGRIIREYLSIHKKFFKKYCPFGTDHKYYKLLRHYRGQGYYLPELNGDVDVETIKKYLPKIKAKLSWIEGLVSSLKKQKKLPDYRKIRAPLISLQNYLLILKKKYQTTSSSYEKKQILEKSQEKLKEFEQEYFNFIKEIPFLTSFEFPVDHFKNRKMYDEFKTQGTKKKHKANDIYFDRKLLEDGAYDPDHTRPDKFLRATLDTLAIAIKEQSNFLSENVRYDLEYVFSRVEKNLKRGYKNQLKRLVEWKNRTEKGYEYYKKILSESKVKMKKGESELTKTQELMRDKAKATFILKDFVLSKEADVYNYWAKKSELLKALFSIETILFNEVGDVDGRDALERKDVIQVIINRYKLPFYQQISKKEDIYPYLKERLSDEEIQSEHWLNVLFKTGEFSFTYFYIPGVVNIFCPDQSRRGAFLRKENLRLALNMLEDPQDDFKATRYFSRASMVGRIDMSQIWSGFTAMPERPGPQIRLTRRARRLFKKGKYQYLYSFISPDEKNYQVITIDDKYYVMLVESGRTFFFKYRNPHLFTYFIED